MNRRTINIVIAVGVLSIISILLVQVLWINRTIRAQQDAIIIQQLQDSIDTKQFEESVRIALRNVVEDLGTNNIDQADIYGAVKQKSSNYFLVDINENLHPYYLEQLLKRTFYNHGIYQSFQYGIYDCYNDSIIYGNLINFTRDSLYSSSEERKKLPSPKMKWQRDGHYFTVFFPDIESKPTERLVSEKSPWIYVGIIAILLLLFFAISISVILRQKKISEIKSDFVNNMTHELKTPISTIGLSSEILLKIDIKENYEKTKKYIEVIHNENKRLEKQVNRVLNMARLDSGQLQLNREEKDIHEIISNIVEDFNFNNIDTKNPIELALNAIHTISYVDVIHLSNIIKNLLDNALKYSQNKPEIKIKTQNQENYIIISITDNGIGIAKEHIEHIFEQFYRVPTGDQHDVKGFGIGLYYAKMIIDKHQGKIEVKSKLNLGSTFFISLPIKK